MDRLSDGSAEQQIPALALALTLWAMRTNRFVSSVIRLQRARDLIDTVRIEGGTEPGSITRNTAPSDPRLRVALPSALPNISRCGI